MMKFIDKILNRRRDEDKHLDELVKASNDLIASYSGLYQSVAYETFDRLPLNNWFKLGEASEVMLLKRTEHEIAFIATFLKGDLNYHKHTDAIEVFMLIDGVGELIVKDHNGKKILQHEKFEKGKLYQVDAGLYHKFHVSSKAITYGTLRKFKVESEN